MNGSSPTEMPRLHPNTTKAIAVIDDDESVCSALALLLESDGWQTHTFASATEFLAKGVEMAYSCLLLDLHMPNMNGVGLIQTLATRGMHPPTIVLTAHPDGLLADGARAAGTRMVLAKPFDPAVLLEEIRRVVYTAVP